MQAIRSRAAQTKLLSTGPCPQAATTVARRVTTAAPRRGLRVGDVFTACYSAMFATAAVVDAQVKQRRTRHWDQLIEDAKSTPVPQPNEIEPPETLHESPEIEDVPLPVEEVLDQGILKPLRKRRVIPGTVPEEIKLPEFRATRARPSDIVMGDPLDNYLIAPAETQRMLKIIEHHITQAFTAVNTRDSSRSNTEALRGEPHHESLLSKKRPTEMAFEHREPLTAVHMMKVQQMISKLVTGLLLETKPLAGSKYQALHDADELQSLRPHDEYAMSSADDYSDGWTTTLPSYQFIDFKGTPEERIRLNHSLEVACEAAQTNSNIDLLVAKICYNLLVSIAAPNIDTYNILLKHFTRLKQPHLGEIVANSFFYDSKFRPNDTTVVLLLHHYIAANDVDGFRRFIQRMRGHCGDLRLRRVHIGLIPGHEFNTAWARSYPTVHRDGTLRQKASRSVEMFSALVDGCLKFHLQLSASIYARAAFREGTAINCKSLDMLIDSFERSNDLREANKLLKTLIKNIQLVDDLIGHLFEPLARLLRLCGIVHSLDSGDYDRRSLPRHISINHFWPFLQKMTSIKQTQNKYMAEGQEALESLRIESFRVSLKLLGPHAPRHDKVLHEMVSLAPHLIGETD